MLAIRFVPESAGTTKIPDAENVPVLRTEPIVFLVTVALVTSFPVNVVVEIEKPPKPIPTTSGELVKAISEILLPEIVMPFSKPVTIPPLAVLLGATVLMRF